MNYIITATPSMQHEEFHVEVDHIDASRGARAVYTVDTDSMSITALVETPPPLPREMRILVNKLMLSC